MADWQLKIGIFKNTPTTILAKLRKSHLTTHLLVYSLRELNSLELRSLCHELAICSLLVSQHAETPDRALVTRAVPSQLTTLVEGRKARWGGNKGAGMLDEAGGRCGAFGQIGILCPLVHTSTPCKPAHIAHQHLGGTTHC